MYFPKYDDWKTEFADKDLTTATDENTASTLLLNSLKDSEDEELIAKKEDNVSSLAQGIGASYSEASNQYADAAKQSIGQQMSFTSGASGRNKSEAFQRTQESLMQNTAQQNTQFSTASRELTKAGTDLQSKYDYDIGKLGRDLESAGTDRDYKAKAGKVQWEESIYDTLKYLDTAKAWDDEEEPDYGSAFWYLGDKPGKG